MASNKDPLRFIGGDIFVDAAYTYCFIAPLYFSHVDNLAAAVACFFGLVVLDNLQLIQERKTSPRYFKFLGRKSILHLSYFFRHTVVVVTVFATASGVIPGAVYAAVGVLFLALKTVLETRLKRVASSKFPVLVGSTSWTPSEWNLITDYNHKWTVKRVSLLSLTEAALLAIPFLYIGFGPALAYAGMGATAVFYLAVFGGHLLWGMRLLRTGRERAEASVNSTMEEVEPEVMLFFSGGTNSTYQANMWFSVLENLDKKVLVLFRERHHIPHFEETDLPLVFLDTTRELEELIPESVVVTLYVANVGKNIHWLRNVDNTHIFIGHGDSDKDGSAHNLMKSYDHMMVAGEAHIDRMKAAGIEMPDEYYIKVGRPQLELFLGGSKS